MAAIGDVVPPRDRGRYQGIFGAVFGLASVIGPLLGGFFTTSLSWRWIFYVNLPIGVAAFAVLAATLPSRQDETHHRIDYLGAGLLAGALTALVLLCTLGGTDYAWGSPQIVVLGVIALVLVVGFVLVEQRAAEPVLPPRLFRDRVFSVTSGIGLVVGFALFGSVTYLPLFLQVVLGASPTGSGLQILPLMAGLLITSILSGQYISRKGRYKPFPIAGTAIMVVGLFLLSTMDPATTRAAASGFMFVLGLGLGLTMQVLVLAVQNAVDYKDLGVATSGATLFRSIGGSVGTAVLGSIFSAGDGRRVAGHGREPEHGGVEAAAGADPRRVPQRLHQRPVHGVHRRGLRGRRRLPAQLGARAAPPARDDHGEHRAHRFLRSAAVHRLAGRGVTGDERLDRPGGAPRARGPALRARRGRPLPRRRLAHRPPPGDRRRPPRGDPAAVRRLRHSARRRAARPARARRARAAPARPHRG
jgi:predicted MFS family arabinose efflux permease